MALLIELETAKKIYDYQPRWFQEHLEKAFEKGCFKKINFKDFKTFEDLCQATGTTEEEFNKKWDPAIFDPSTIAFERMKICTRAYNQDWKYNLYDTTQKKWAPIFEVLSSGLGFSYSDCDYDYTLTCVGSRLCFADESRSDHAGKTFPILFLNLNNAKY